MSSRKPIKYLSTDTKKIEHVTLMVRVPPELRKRVRAYAKKAGISVNLWMNDLLKHLLDPVE